MATDGPILEEPSIPQIDDALAMVLITPVVQDDRQVICTARVVIWQPLEIPAIVGTLLEVVDKLRALDEGAVTDAPPLNA